MIHKAPSFIQTPRLHLRCFNKGDVRVLHSLLKDESVRAGTTHWRADFEIAQVRAWLSAVSREQTQKASLVYAICDQQKRLMGEVSLVEIYEGTANLTYWLGRPYWGQGYATEAGEALVSLAMSLGFQDLTALHLQTNGASKRVLEKLEFDFVEAQERSHRGTLKPFRFYRKHLRLETSLADYSLA